MNTNSLTMAAAAYAYPKGGKDTEGGRGAKTEAAQSSFLDHVTNKAEEAAQTQKAQAQRALKSGTSVIWSGDIFLQEPPDFRGFPFDSAALAKPKEEMTLEEYKQWFVKELSRLPVSGYYRANFTGTTVITEEAFVQMKNDPAWEQNVLNQFRQKYLIGGLPQKCCVYQVIGASPADSYSVTIPLGNRNALNRKEKSWWDKRRERMKKLLQEQIIRARLKRMAESRAESLDYLNCRLENHHRLHCFLTEEDRNAMNDPAVQVSGDPASAAALYESLLAAYSAQLRVK